MIASSVDWISDLGIYFERGRGEWKKEKGEGRGRVLPHFACLCIFNRATFSSVVITRRERKAIKNKISKYYHPPFLPLPAIVCEFRPPRVRSSF